MSIKYANYSQVNSTLYSFSQCHIFTHASTKTVGQGHHEFTKASFNKTRSHLYINLCRLCLSHSSVKKEVVSHLPDNVKKS